MKPEIAEPLVNPSLQALHANLAAYRETVWQHKCGRFLAGMSQREFVSARWRTLVSVLRNGKKKKHFLIDIETSTDILRTIRANGCLVNGVQNCQEWETLDLGSDATIWRDPELRAVHGSHVLSTTLDDITPELPTTKCVARRASTCNYRCKGCKHPSRMTHTALAEGVLDLYPAAATRGDLILCLDGQKAATHVQLEAVAHFALGKGILSAPAVAVLLDRATVAATVASSSRALYQAMRSLLTVQGTKPLYLKLLRIGSLTTKVQGSDQLSLASRFAARECSVTAHLKAVEARLVAQEQSAGSFGVRDDCSLRLVRAVLEEERRESVSSQHVDGERADAVRASTAR